MKDIITMYFAMPFLENFDTNLALIFYWSYKCYSFYWLKIFQIPADQIFWELLWEVA